VCRNAVPVASGIEKVIPGLKGLAGAEMIVRTATFLGETANGNRDSYHEITSG